MFMKINIILFGFGRAGKVHYDYLLNNPYFNLTHIIELFDITEMIDNSIKYVNPLYIKYSRINL